jgi:hypothetical protein
MYALDLRAASRKMSWSSADRLCHAREDMTSSSDPIVCSQIHSQIEGHDPCRLKQTNGDREYSVRAKPVNRQAALLCLGSLERSGDVPTRIAPTLEMPRPELGPAARWSLPPRALMVANVIGNAF